MSQRGDLKTLLPLLYIRVCKFQKICVLYCRYIPELLEALEVNFLGPKGTIGILLQQFNRNYSNADFFTLTTDFDDLECYDTLVFDMLSEPLAITIMLFGLELSSKVPFELWNNDIFNPEQLLVRLKGDTTGDDLIKVSKTLLQHVQMEPSDCTLNESDIELTAVVNLCFKGNQYKCCKTKFSYRQALKTLKYTHEADVGHIFYKSDINDIGQGLHNYNMGQGNGHSMRQGGARSSNVLFHSDPVILGCDYGKVSLKMSIPCTLFRRYPTANGLDYVFNQAPFWKIFKNETWSMDFYRELIEREDDFSENVHVLRPRSNGQGFSFRFMVRQPHNMPRSPENDIMRTVIIYHPNSVGPLTSDRVAILPGIHYSILVTPTVIQTKKELLDLAPSKRGCISKSDPNILKIFATYTYENCLFECQLKIANDKCGCIPWDFPRFGDSTPICTLEQNFECFVDAFSTSRDLAFCNECLIDCDTVTYSINVLTNNINIAKLCPHQNNTVSLSNAYLHQFNCMH